MKKSLFIVLTLAAFLSAAVSPAKKDKPLDQLAEDYVKLALVVGAYAPGYIDAYYGPEAWVVKHDDSVLRRGFFASELRKKAIGIIKSLDAAARSELSALEKLRCEFLGKQMIALKAEIDVLSGKKFSFNQESKLFYDAVAPVHSREEFEKTIAALEAVLPGSGSLVERIAALRKDFIIPADKLPAVFDAAIAECRRRTLAHIALPQNENFKAEYVKNKSWGAYNWYKGNAFSVIEVNTDLPMDISGPLRLAAHEGYPGHHVFNALLEQKLVKERGWVEFTVYPLFSPQSLIAEGTANYGMELIFSAEERLKFEKDVLYPLAGLDPRHAAKFAQVQKLISGLSYAENEAARGYLDGKISKEDAIEWLTRYALESPERAAKSIDFWKQYRSYIINYNLGQDIIRNYIEKTAGTDQSLQRKWEIFFDILSTPRTPSGLKIDINMNNPELVIHIDRDSARRFGLSTSQIAGTIRTALFGREVSKFKEGEDEYPIVVRLAKEYRGQVASLLNQKISFRSNTGALMQVPISSVTRFQYGTTFGAVNRLKMERVVTLWSNIIEGYNANAVNAQLQGLMKQYPMPEGFSYKFTGEQQEQAETSAFLARVMLIALALITMILVLQFNSFAKPLIIMITVILSTIGVFGGLAAFKMDFVILMTGIGIISLAGVVVNNAIVLVDYTDFLIANTKKRLGLDQDDELSLPDTKDCIQQAGRTRLRPVLLTAITTILGLLPMAVGLNIDFAALLADFNPHIYLGGDNAIFWGPMSWTVIFGLSFTTVLTLVLVPNMYYLSHRLKLAFRARFKKE